MSSQDSLTQSQIPQAQIPEAQIPQPHITAYGDSAVMLRYPVTGFSDAANLAVLSIAKALRAQAGWEDVISSYDSVLGRFNPEHIRLGAALNRLQLAAQAVDITSAETPNIIDIAVHYGGEDGPDIAAIADSSGLSEAEVVALHSGQIYRVCMMGFIPGFAFLSDAPAALHHPRHATPRAHVRAGSIGIAGWQTGIYGLSSPGGWQIIGRTDSVMFDPNRRSPFALKAGDSVRFVPMPRGGSETS